MQYSTRSSIVTLGGVSVFAIIIFALLISTTRHTICNTRPPLVSIQKHNERKLHTLFPVNSGAGNRSVEFCRTLLSALVHGYEPIVINWDAEQDAFGMQRMKATGE